MTELEKYEAINKAESASELQAAILQIADEDGMIVSVHGKKKAFDAKELCKAVPLIVYGPYPPNLLTRTYGIRQQALHLKYYHKDEWSILS